MFTLNSICSKKYIYFKNKGNLIIPQLGIYTKELKTGILTNPMYVHPRLQKHYLQQQEGRNDRNVHQCMNG